MAQSELKITTKPSTTTGPKARRRAASRDAFAVLQTAATSGDHTAAATYDQTLTAEIDKVFEIRHNVFDAKESSELYEQLVKRVEEDSGGVEAKLRPLFGRKTPRTEHRLKAYYSKIDESYGYSGTPQINKGWPDPMEYLSQRASELIRGEEFLRGLANLYRTGNDHTGEHIDTDAMKGYIVGFSFYKSSQSRIRTLYIKSKDGGPVLRRVPMPQGSVTIMKPGMQQLFKHSVPASKTIKDGRINVTLRQRQ